jgi:hypothetical protein
MCKAFGYLSSIAAIAVSGALTNDTNIYGQNPRCRVPTCAVRSSSYTLHRTYNGGIYFSFPNVTVNATRAPRDISDAISSRGRGSSVVYRNGNGLAWDGEAYFQHSAYHRELVTRHHLSQRNISSSWEMPSHPPAMRPMGQAGPPPRHVPMSTASTINYLPATRNILTPSSSVGQQDRSRTTDVTYPEAYMSPGIKDHVVQPPARQAPGVTLPRRPSYCGNRDAVSTALQPLSRCQP